MMNKSGVFDGLGNLITIIVLSDVSWIYCKWNSNGIGRTLLLSHVLVKVSNVSIRYRKCALYERLGMNHEVFRAHLQKFFE
jgi:hypothetical protein